MRARGSAGWTADRRPPEAEETTEHQVVMEKERAWPLSRRSEGLYPISWTSSVAF